MDEKGQKQILGSGRLRVGSGSSHETYLTTAYGQGQTFLDRSDKGSLSDCFRDMADKNEEVAIPLRFLLSGHFR